MRDFSELDMSPQVSDRPSPELFARVEAIVGHALPQAYKALLMHANGGTTGPRASTFVPLGDPSERWMLNEFYPLVDDEQEVSGVLGAYRMLRRTLPPECLPIGRDPGDSEICLDFRDDPPSVKLFDFEFNDREIFVAPTFEAFLDLLSPSRA
jgi:hypothetical protein